MNFTSDHVFGVHPVVMEALNRANEGTAASYSGDDWTARAEALLRDIFECELDMFLVTSGTMANALALSTMLPPYGAALCHETAHIMVDECGAVTLFSGGAQLHGVPGAGGKMTAESVQRALDGFVRFEHDPKPAAISLTQSTELGTLYAIDEIAAISGIARSAGLKVHMDGARFANACAALDCRPADMTWRAGIDALSFGTTKNGTLGCDAVVFFDRALAVDFDRRRMRAGQNLSKSRYLGAQMVAILEHDLWLKNAAHANDMARLLAEALAGVNGVRLRLDSPTNGVFPIVPRSLAQGLRDAGALFHDWPGGGPETADLAEGEAFVRLITSWQTSRQDVDDLVKVAAALS